LEKVLTLVVHYQVQPDKGDVVAATLANHTWATRQEPGCLQFITYRSLQDPDSFVLYEQYVDEDSFEAHRQSPHFERYVRDAIMPLLAERSFDRYDEVTPEPGEE
jgi:(4S)-4-hydroxy-5-phosphonooxypentane-2,3-dione isomerase